MKKLYSLFFVLACALRVLAGQYNGHEYVDLGLPSGTKWANMNVGASSPEEYGLYFAWGETQGYTSDTNDGRSFNWASYKWMTPGQSSYTKINKYTYPDGQTSAIWYNNSIYFVGDNKTTLDPEDDAAHVNWGGEWRMPTHAEQQELVDNCTVTWTSDYNGTGVAGRIFTSGSNGNSIFLPAAGYRVNASLNNAGSYGSYWSLSLYEIGSDFAWGLFFNSGGVGSDGFARYYGRSVRAVCPAPAPTTYTITFLGANGEELQSSEVAEGEMPAYAGATPTKAEDANYTYEFSGWSPTIVAATAVATYTAQFTATQKVTQGLPAGVEMVDLGLPSGIKWASVNVGASSPEEYGLYFAWGETQGYTSDTNDGRSFDWASYKYCNGSYDTMTKYCINSSYSNNGFTDGKTTLDLEDDAAHVNWGANWRMPTHAEHQELRNTCTWTWTTLNGVNGYRVTGTNGNSIFLPAAGYRFNSDLNAAGSNGYYWSSSLYENDSRRAFGLYFHCFIYDRTNYDYRNIGRSVRAVCPSSTNPEPEPCLLASGTCGAEGDNLTWELDCDGVLTISGTGAMRAFAYFGDQPWFAYNQQIKKVIVGEGITTITESAFSYCENINEVVLPNSLQTIGSVAFSECYGLKEINLPDNLTTLSSAAFQNCQGLKHIVIPSALSKLEFGVFQGCKSLDNVVIPNTITEIEGYAFGYCDSLRSIVIPASITKIETGMLEGCVGLESIVVDDANSVYDSRNNCNAIIVTESNELMMGCKNTIIPDGVVKIRELAFQNICQIETVNIPSSITTIGTQAFYNDSLLTRIDCYLSSPITIDENTFFNVPSSCQLVVPHGTKSIWETAPYWNELTIVERNGMANGHEYVDLGLPSGTLWATMNLGATCPSDTGSNFAWGELETKSTFLRSNYQYYKSGSYIDIGTDISGSQYDAATYHWGNGWQMPTYAQCDELIENTTMTSQTIDGNVCMLVTSKLNGNSIIVPGVIDVDASAANGRTCYGFAFWTSTAAGSSFAYRQWEWSYISNGYREQHYPIRPVCHVTRETYTITFANYDGTTLQEIEVEEGETPAYTGETPVKPEDADSTYTFAGWDREVVVATEDATYTATYTATAKLTPPDNKFTWHAVADGMIGDVIAEAGVPTMVGNIENMTIKLYDGGADWMVKTDYCPTFDGANGITYYRCYIQGGTNGTAGSLMKDGVVSAHVELTPAVDGNAYIAAKYGNSKPIWLIEVPNEDIESGDFDYGNLTSYMVPGYSEVKGDVKAYINEIGDGVTLTQVTSTTSVYGALPIPVKAGYTYMFWVEGSKLMLSAVTFIPGEPQPLDRVTDDVYYTIRYVNEDNTLLQTYDVLEGDFPYFYGDNPTKEDDADSTYTFAGWDKEVVVATEEVTYIATFIGRAKLCTKPDGVEYVDLGLPSGTLWATMNLGATCLSDTGNIYAWGEVLARDRTSFKRENYEYYQSGGYVNIGDDIVGTQYDAAKVSWGEDWQMPTLAQCEELNQYVTRKDTIIDGRACLFVTSTINGNTMIVPGVVDETLSRRNGYNVYGYGFWTGTGMSSYAYRQWEWSYVSYSNRWEGFAIRPVCQLNRTSYAITFVNYDGTTLQVSDVEEGETPVYTGETPVKPKDADSTYTFSGWDKEIVAATAVATYTATYTGTARIFPGNSVGVEIVDLGLPSGTLWANMNVGATAPEEYGDYFAWGEVAPKTDYSMSTYKYCKGSYDSMTKYCTQSVYGYNGFRDNKTTLDPEDDAAQVNWGGDWRMPTVAELNELLSNCIWTWTTLNGVKGYRVTGSNGNSLFFPATGIRRDLRLDDAGFEGSCWSSLLSENRSDRASDLCYSSSDNPYVWYDARCDGRSVRPVYVGDVPCLLASGTCGANGDNLTWELSCDSVLTISGTGAMADWETYESPGYSYREFIKKVVITEGVTSIGDNAFRDCSSLTSITIPASVTSIGNAAFYYCSALTSITIPEGVTTIGDWAFSYCTSLTSITIPEGVTSIGAYAFGWCSSLTSITIPEGVTSIGENAFSGCSGLTSIVVEAGNTVYDSRNNCNAIIETASNTLIVGCQNTFIPESVTSIGNAAFFYCLSLTSITIPASVTSIGDWVFGYCTSLTSITIPEGVTSIGKSAFYYCPALTSITIPESVTNIGEYAFSACSSLTSITILEGVTSIGASAFSNCSALTSITIPEGVTSIGDYAFFYCTALTSITIPEGVTSIGESAFEDCFSLTSLTCEAVTPPTLGSVCFNRVEKSILVYVPCKAVDAYKAANQWGEFTNIQPIEGTCPTTYTITFKNYDGTTLQEIEVEEGETPAYTGVIPVKPATADSVYYFTGWTPEIMAASADATYTAQFTANAKAIVDGSVEVLSTSGRTSCEYVQLWEGSPKWATFNVGATITDYANLTVDADATPFYDYQDQAPYYNTANVGGLYAWNNPDLNGRQTTWEEDAATGVVDVATTLWGSNWKTPSYDDLNNLQSSTYTTWTWCDGGSTQYVPGCTLKGYKVSGVDEYADKSIFLPASGYFSYNNGTVYSASIYGYYWSSTMYDSYDAFGMGFCSDGRYMYSYGSREFGLSVRAVLAEPTYTITFKNYDGTTLQEIEVEEGATPVYTDETPVKPDDADSIYTFAGWDKEIVAATEDATYTATYTATAVADLHCVYFTNPENWSSVGCYIWDGDNQIFGSWPGKTATKFGDVYRVVTPVGVTPNDNWMIIWNNDGDGSQTGDMKYVDGATYDMYGVVDGGKYCGPNLTWEFDEETGTLTIEGTGDMDEWGFSLSVPWSSFSTSIHSVLLPSGVTGIGNYAFYFCSNLTSITCEATTPPSCGYDYFYGVDKSIPVYVPCESVDAYKAAAGWRDFTNIQAIPSSCPVSTYTITFVNYDGTTLQESEVEEGETPAYTGATPSKPETTDSVYCFAGWDKEIVAATADATYTATYTAKAKRTVIEEDVNVQPDQDYELGCNTTADDITISVNGGLIAADDCGAGSNPEAGDITVEVGEDGNAGSIIACENGLIADNLIISIPLKADTWYQLCFPFDVALSNLNFGAGVEYLIRHYNGNERALNGKGGWKNGVGGGVKMHAFKGYAVAVSANTTLTVTIPTPNFTCEISNYILEVATSAINALHSSWNFMGNPFPCYYNIKDLFTGGENDHLTSTLYIYDPTIDDYIVKRLGADGDDYILYPYQAFFVQNPDNEPLEINWQAAGRLTAKMIADMAAHAPARAPRSVDSSRAFVELTLAAEGMRADETRIVFNEQASTDYEIRGDAMKMAGSAPIRLYTWDNLTGYAINERPSGEVNLGFSVRQEGDYTLSAKRMDTDIRLYDNLLHQSVDLSWGDYTFYTVAGTDNNRFTIYRAPQTTTAVEDIVTNLMNEDVTIYTVVGQLLYQNVRMGDITLPTGTYLIHAASETVKYVVY